MFSICRLCANCKDEVDLTTQITVLESKLALCCGWYPSDNETQLPRKVCNTCVSELDKCWCFAQKVRDGERKINKLLEKQSEAAENHETPADDAVENDEEVCIFELNELHDSSSNHDAGEASLDRSNIHSDAESSDSNKIEKELPDVDPFLDHLSDEDRILGGTISHEGVLKLEKLYPDMKTISWSNCLHKCVKCNLTIEGKELAK